MMEKIIRGIVRFNQSSKAAFANLKIGTNAQPKAVFFSCMDSRVLPSKFLDTEAGDVFFVRNAGNMVPAYQSYENGNIGTEGAALELGCIVNHIRDVFVCGHSDCKAINALYDLRHACNHTQYKLNSPLKTWITFHGSKSVQKLSDAIRDDHDGNYKIEEPLVLKFNIANKDLTAVIDKDNKFCNEDKFSQIHCLQQASHISSYPQVQDLVVSNELKVYAMWFDVYSGDVYLFSPRLQQFTIVDESNVDQLIKDVKM